MPDTMQKYCPLFPILITYQDWQFTRDFDHWNEKLNALIDQNGRSIIRNMVNDDFMVASSADQTWFTVFRGRRPGIYDS